ncbi:MAG: DUF2491 family protein [Patescibacteria group bacterium]
MGLVGRMLGLKIAQVGASLHKKPERLDMNLPLGIRIGSTAQFDASTFIIAGDELEFVPPTGRCLCHGYSRLNIAGFNYYRFYLQDDSPTPRDFILQVGMDENKPAEFILYQPYLDIDICPEGEIFPASVEEWNEWLDETNGFIGGQILTIPGGTSYDRVINPERDKRINPFEYTEKTTFDAFEAPSQNTKICGMTYGRTITVDEIETKEFALPEKREDNAGAFIAVLIGVEIMATEIVVL